jgi:hypothetical protein
MTPWGWPSYNMNNFGRGPTDNITYQMANFDPRAFIWTNLVDTH